LDQLDKKRSSATLKTHDEILNLFKEIETIEENIKKQEHIEETVIHPDGSEQEIEFIDVQEVEFIDITDETTKEVPFQEVPTDKKPERPKEKRFFHLKRKKIGVTKDTQEPLKPIKSTFTLKIDDQGNLAGLNVKRPRPKKEKKPFKFKLFKRGEAKESAPDETETKEIPGKIKGIFSKLKRGKSGESKGEGGGSKISGIG